MKGCGLADSEGLLPLSSSARKREREKRGKKKQNLFLCISKL
jgi:hypothetical protein